MQSTILIAVVATLVGGSLLALVGMAWAMIQKAMIQGHFGEWSGNAALGTLHTGFLPKPLAANETVATNQKTRSRRVIRRRSSSRLSAWGFSTNLRPVPTLNADRKSRSSRRTRVKSTRRAPR